MRSVSANLTALILIVLTTTGCGTPVNTSPPAKGTSAKSEGAEHTHDHDAAGPHQGQLIELGKEEYHAELVHDEDAHTVTLYLLDGDAKKSVPIEAKELVLNLVVDGKPKQYSLAARPEQNESAGKCSCFSLKDEALCEALDAKGTKCRFNVDIDGKHYSGTVEHHDHDHDKHDHDKHGHDK